MNQITLFFISLLAVALVGCSSSSNDNANTADDSAGDNSGGAAADPGGDTTETTDGSVDPQGNNPGKVPTVLAELTTLDITSTDAPRGHKIFTGNEIRVLAPESEDSVENSYLNLDFPCSGEGVFTFWPSVPFATIWQPGSGNFTWGTVDAADEDYSWGLEATGFLSGDPDNGIFVNGITVQTIVNGALIVGTAVAENLVVKRIVQYEECS